ncbi:caspase-23 isoform X1 [Tachysurus fulvidraco]|uniref:caspase-23 isoform X1 n=1 Tax=Tachysurus fulvidraco TaxID=1234273 RepID=UPI001FEF2363|nr:caspase-23 isoform X1 [Tachysurus fulvidraco]
MSNPKEEDRDLKDAAPTTFLRKLRISIGGKSGKSDILPGQRDALLCGHQMPSSYLISWCKFNLQQKKTEFTCPRFDEDKKGICGTKFSYQDLSHTVPLTPSLKEFFEARIGELSAAQFCEFKPCPGCNSKVERADKMNLCVHCTICTAQLGYSYEFCWNCSRKWEGAAQIAVRCGHSDCNKAKTLKKKDLLTLCQSAFKTQKLQTEEKQVLFNPLIINHELYINVNGTIAIKLAFFTQIYPTMEKSKDRKRLAMIINNVEFRVSAFNRLGAEKDEESMRILLEALGYDVIILNDLSAEGMEAAVRDFSQHNEHRYSDSTFLVIMSHGGPDGIYGIDYDKNEDDIFLVDKIFHYLGSANCPGLTDKPKIILIQACRGDQDGHVWVCDGVRSNQGIKQHREKDFACFRSCTPDTVSMRNTGTGSVFIQNLVKIFNDHCHEDDIMELFRKVAYWFENAAKENDIHYQMPSLDRTTLVKKFYLFPGL